MIRSGSTGMMMPNPTESISAVIKMKTSANLLIDDSLKLFVLLKDIDQARDQMQVGQRSPRADKASDRERFNRLGILEKAPQQQRFGSRGNGACFTASRLDIP